jgi:hypothetical protein
MVVVDLWEPGTTVVRREVLHGRPWLECPVTVVADTGRELAVLLEPGAPFTFHDHPFGAHPWTGRSAWGGTRVLQLYRPSDLYSVWALFDDAGLRTWYINFEAPLVRRVEAFETCDYGLDIVIELGGEWRWEDVDDLDEMRRSGRGTHQEVASVNAEAQKVASELRAGRRWWSGWDDWTPPPRG